MTSIYCRDPDGNLLEIAAYDGPAVEDRGLGLVVRLRNGALCKDSRSTESDPLWDDYKRFGFASVNVMQKSPLSSSPVGSGRPAVGANALPRLSKWQLRPSPSMSIHGPENYGVTANVTASSIGESSGSRGTEKAVRAWRPCSPSSLKNVAEAPSRTTGWSVN